MTQEQINEFHGILIENGWTELTVADLRNLKKLLTDTILKDVWGGKVTEHIVFKGSKMLPKFGFHLLIYYTEYGI